MNHSPGEDPPDIQGIDSLHRNVYTLSLCSPNTFLFRSLSKGHVDMTEKVENYFFNCDTRYLNAYDSWVLQDFPPRKIRRR